ncbi:hypothetical protein F5146DRAFT_551519 [Armillaria mellea]|nr:hypothetical protein F5146DRAFT_551519 [Armillaria mellea]
MISDEWPAHETFRFCTSIRSTMSFRFWSTPLLDVPPACFTAEEQAAVDSAPSTAAVARQYDALIRRHGPYPFFLAQLGNLHRCMNTQATSITLYRQAQAELAKMGVHDSQFDSWIEARQTELDKNVRTALEISNTDLYYQIWKPTKDHKFPLQAPIPPSGHDQVKEEWEQMSLEGSSSFTKYLSHLAIETNHLEGTFLITAGDLIRRGIADGVVDTQPQSHIHDASTIKSILNDTLAV